MESLNEVLLDIRNPAVKGTLRGVSLDSLKHAEMYGSAINLLTGVSPALTQEQLDKQRELVEKHIRIEAELIERINEVLPSLEDEKVKLLLKTVLSDERRDPELLKRVLEILVKGERITDEEWWDMLWRDVPFHGAPRG